MEGTAMLPNQPTLEERIASAQAWSDTFARDGSVIFDPERAREDMVHTSSSNPNIRGTYLDAYLRALVEREEPLRDEVDDWLPFYFVDVKKHFQAGVYDERY